jgi:hypothetical protein
MPATRASTAATHEEAEQFAQRAEDIFAKLRISSFGVDADVVLGQPR